MDIINKIDLVLENENNEKEIMDGIKNVFEKHFSNGWFNLRKISSDSIGFSFGIIGDKKELSSGILDNDPVHHKFMIRKEEMGWEVKNLFGSIAINPKEKYMAMSSVKTKFRKTKGDTKKIISTFDKWFVKLKSLIKDNEENIYQRSNYSDKFFK
ncbi:MAG: hypothetical protein KQ78_02144 [Candidatus Izimaplasma bacterium HR2]|nr:MAG: hypothetical protein KQ78_02144 [Candidatus Izimaplasma bacterium HR2]